MAGGFGARPFGKGEHGKRLEPLAAVVEQPIDLVGGGALVVDIPGRGTRWSAQVTDDTGTVARLPVSMLSPIVRGRNQSATCGVEASITDVGATAVLATQFRKLQVYRGDQLLFSGRFTDDDASTEGNVVAQARGPMWDLSRRYVGPAGRTNHLVDSDNVSWSENTDPTPGVWHGTRTQGPGFGFQPVAGQLSKVTTPVRPGFAYSMKGVATAGDEEDRLSLTQNVTFDGGVFGLYVDFVGWFYVPTSGGLTGPAHKDRGVFLTTTQPVSQWATPPPLGYFSENLDYAQSRITLDHPRDSWVRHTASLFIPPDTVRVVWCSLNFPPGTSYWSSMRLYTDEAEDFPDTDLFDIVDGLVTHAQDTALTPPKSALGITVIGQNPFGTNLTRRYPHQEHANIAGAIQEFAAEGLLEWEEQWSPDAGFVRIEYDASQNNATGIGSYKPEHRVRVTASSSNVSALSRSRPASSASSSVTAMGVGDDVAREEAAAWDTDAFAGGLMLEEVFVASETADGGALQALADTHLAVVKRPQVITYTVAAGDPRVTGLHVSDWHDVLVDLVALQVDELFEVVSKSTDPKTDEATFVCNPRRT